MINLRKKIEKFYNISVQERIYELYLKDAVESGLILNNIGIKGLDKQSLTGLIYEFFTNKEIFFYVYSKFSKELKIILNQVVWNGFFKIDEITEKYSLTVLDEEKNLVDNFLFFKQKQQMYWGVENKAYIYLEEELAASLKQFLEKPKNYYLNGIEKIESNYSMNCEVEFLRNFTDYMEHLKDGKIKLSSGGRVLKESNREFKELLDLKEFYLDDLRELEFLKTNIITTIFSNVKIEVEENDVLKYMKKLFEKFDTSDLDLKKSNYFYSNKFLDYLNGLNNVWNGEEALKESLITIKNVLLDSNNKKWFSIENIFDYITYRNLEVGIISFSIAKDYLYVSIDQEDRIRIDSKTKYNKFIKIPFIKSLFFILSSFGIVEVAYDKIKKEKRVSKYDGLRYVRLTELGSYVLGLNKEYIKEEQEDEKIILDEERLIITVLGRAKQKREFLEKVSKKITENQYLFNYADFFKDLKDLEDLNIRISQFRNIISLKSPEIWEAFFENAINQKKYVEKVNDLVVLKLKEDRQLIKLIAEDSFISTNILKAENYHILVEKEKVNLVMEKLKEYGYFNELI